MFASVPALAATAMDPWLIAVIAVGVLILLGAGVAVGRRRRGGRAGTDSGSRPGGGEPEGRQGVVSAEPPADATSLPDTGQVLPEVPDTPEALTTPPEGELDAPVAPVEEDLGLGERFRRRLSRTRNVLGASVVELFGRGVSEEAWEGLEEALIAADVGVTATMEIVEELKRRAREEGATDADAVLRLLKEELTAALGEADRTLRRAGDDEPTVWLITGVNGTGKTTTIGKLAAVEQRGQQQVVLAAADTFRAAASEQLGIWAERTGAQLVAKEPGADPGSVAYEAYDVATSRAADLLIVDTAGRLHNKTQLMDELGKVKRVLEKRAGPLEETLLVLDATTGQNGIAQARAFLEAVEVTGIALTKLDGSSRGGIVVAVQRELDLPVKLVGLGEGIDDLAVFDPELFVEGLFAELAG